jgi:DNA-binding transcriptional MerR regulator
MGQIIALRFADDEEYLALVKRAAEEGLSNDEIKKTIKKWKADHHRV